LTELVLHLLGGFQAKLDQVPITGFKTDKVRALLAYLVIESNRPHRRQALAGLFWPGYLESSARHSLRHALSNLRKALSDDRSATPYLLVEGETIQFNLSRTHWLDVEAFRSLVDVEQAGMTTTQRLEGAMSLYQGGFLEGFSLKDCPDFDTWTAILRRELQGKALSALYQLAEEYAQQGELERACQYVRRQLELEPALEQAHRKLMRLLALDGQRFAALAQYETCRSNLRAVLGVEPSDETRRLFEHIRDEDTSVTSGAIKADREPRKTASPIELQPGSRHNLPLQLTNLIGRENELRQLKHLLETHRLVTLTGSGGVGKTRLGIQAGREILEHFPDGVWFIDLAPVTNPNLIPPTVATVLRILAEAEHLKEALISSLCSRHVLLVLDNCEHLLEACANLSETLLRTCANIKILVTSRVPFGVAGEAIFRVPSLAYPEPSQAGTAEELLGYSAVSLLVERVRFSLPDYRVTPQNATALARICQRLDGIPLALELAAARLSVLTAEQVVERLENTFQLLAGGARTALPRHQTLRATIEWSYDLLQDKERLLLHRLSIFSGDCTLEAVEAVCAGGDLETVEILERLTSLVNQSIVNARRKQGEETRYNLLETLQQYAREKLSGEELASLADRHCDYFLCLAEQAEPRLRNAERITWTKKMFNERHNTQQALEWAFSHGDPTAGIRIINALAPRFWQPYEQTAQTICWVREGYKRAHEGLEVSPLQLIRLLICEIHLGSIVDWIVDFKSRLDEIVQLCHQVGSRADQELCFILSVAADYYCHHVDDKTIGLKYIQQCLDVARRLQPEAAWYKACAYYWAGYLFIMFFDDHDLARKYALESWQLFQQVGDRWYPPYLILGYVAQVEGEYEKARQYYKDASSAYHEVDDLAGLLQSIAFLAGLELAQSSPGRAKRAARLMGAVEPVIGFWFQRNLWRNKSAEFFYPQTMRDLRMLLSPDELEAAWDEGANMSLEGVYRYVLQDPEAL
jgi:predicted ATPase/DNA-binding SARP family transcriptional activator